MLILEIIKDFEKLLAVFDSCKTEQQMKIAKRMTYNFFEKYKQEFDSISRQNTADQIKSAMDECSARIVNDVQ